MAIRYGDVHYGTLGLSCVNVPVFPSLQRASSQLSSLSNRSGESVNGIPTAYFSCSAAQQALPTHYRGITQEHLPAELFPGVTVVEHELPASAQRITAPLVLFLLDMCMSEDDLGAMKVRPDCIPSVIGTNLRQFDCGQATGSVPGDTRACHSES